MKNNLLLSTASLAIIGIALPAYAGSYSDDTRTMNDTRTMEASPRKENSTPTQNTQPRYVPNNYEPSAGYEDNPYDDFTGVYGGGEAGYSFTDDLDGWNGGLFLGYGFEHEFDLLGAYAGIELGYEWSGAEGSTGGLNYEKDHAWTATFRPGVTILDGGLGYGIIGYSRAGFEGAGTDEDLDGLVLGLGGQFNTDTAFKPRLEYTYTNYEDGSLGGTNFDPSENAVKLGAVFQF